MIARIFWQGWTRVLVFWLIVIGTIWWLAAIWSPFKPALISEVLRLVLQGDVTGVSTPGFAYALSSGLAAVAAGFGRSFLLLYAVCIPASLFPAQRRIARITDMAAFAASYEIVHQDLRKHPLIGHAAMPGENSTRH
jgi:hypothetical protein